MHASTTAHNRPSEDRRDSGFERKSRSPADLEPDWQDGRTKTKGPCVERCTFSASGCRCDGALQTDLRCSNLRLQMRARLSTPRVAPRFDAKMPLSQLTVARRSAATTCDTAEVRSSSKSGECARHLTRRAAEPLDNFSLRCRLVGEAPHRISGGAMRVCDWLLTRTAASEAAASHGDRKNRSSECLTARATCGPCASSVTFLHGCRVMCSGAAVAW